MPSTIHSHATPLQLQELDLQLSERGADLRERIAAFMDECIMPIERELSASIDAIDEPKPFWLLMAELRATARQVGLRRRPPTSE